jgi:hypothetical protein
VNKKQCDGCGSLVNIDETMSCLSSNVDLNNFGITITKQIKHFDDAWFCKECLNKEGFCKGCQKLISEEKQKEIGEYLDQK